MHPGVWVNSRLQAHSCAGGGEWGDTGPTELAGRAGNVRL